MASALPPMIPLPEPLMHFPQWEVAPGAERCFQLLVHEKAAGAAELVVFEVIDKLGQSGDLIGGGAAGFEIADQADSDGVGIVGQTADVPALNLTGPARADFNFAISGIRAVADNEVVAEPVGHITVVAVETVKDLGIAVSGGAVVDDDVPPAIGIEIGDIDLTLYRRQKGAASSWNFQPLVDANKVPAEAVGLLESGDGDAVAAGDMRQGVPGADDMNRGAIARCGGQ